MAMAGRSLHRLLVSAPSRFRVLHGFSASAFASPAAPALAPDAVKGVVTGASCTESDPFARYLSDSNPACVRASSFSLIHGTPRNAAAIHSAPGTTTLEPLHCNNNTPRTLGLQILAGLDMHDKRSFSTKASTASPPPNDNNTAVIEKPKILDDFQHEEIVGPTVERDVSPVADELREALDILHKRLVSFQKSLILLGSLQGVGAVWCYVTWHAFNPTWQLVPSALLSFLLAFAVRQALQPISFFGKLEERSRLRIITLSLMIAKGFASFFNRARFLVAASAVGLLCVLLYKPASYVLGLLGILK